MANRVAGLIQRWQSGTKEGGEDRKAGPFSRAARRILAKEENKKVSRSLSARDRSNGSSRNSFEGLGEQVKGPELEQSQHPPVVSAKFAAAAVQTKIRQPTANLDSSPVAKRKTSATARRSMDGKHEKQKNVSRNAVYDAALQASGRLSIDRAYAIKPNDSCEDAVPAVLEEPTSPKSNQPENDGDSTKSLNSSSRPPFSSDQGFRNPLEGEIVQAEGGPDGASSRTFEEKTEQNPCSSRSSLPLSEASSPEQVIEQNQADYREETPAGISDYDTPTPNDHPVLAADQTKLAEIDDFNPLLAGKPISGSPEPISTSSPPNTIVMTTSGDYGRTNEVVEEARKSKDSPLTQLRSELISPQSSPPDKSNSMDQNDIGPESEPTEVEDHSKSVMQSDSVLPSRARSVEALLNRLQFYRSLPETQYVGLRHQWVGGENTDNQEVVVRAFSKSSSVYIYGCHRARILVHGNLTAVKIENCSNLHVEVKNKVIGQLELTRSSNVQVAMLSSCPPTFAVDLSDNIICFLPPQEPTVRVVSTASASVVVCHNGKEVCIPSKAISQYAADRRQLVTDVVHAMKA